MTPFEEIVAREQQYLVQTYGRYPLALTRGKGVFVWDLEGRRYLDLMAGIGVNALGHAHPRIVQAIRQQAGRAIHFSNLYYHEFQGKLAERLSKMAGLDRVFFCNSGTEAIEGALKMARAAGHRTGGESKCKLVALDNSFHGRTYGAMSVTGQPKYRKEFEPLLEGVQFVTLNDLEGLGNAVDDDTCAILLEPIQGEGGIHSCTPEFLGEARRLADQHNAVLILDEIQCGMGRTGSMFAYQQMGCVPDVVTVAKPLAAGLPLGAIIVRNAVASAISPGKHGTTFGGGPLACRVALEFLSVLEDEALLAQIERVGTYLHAKLESLIAEFPGLAIAARGRGMIQALELSVPGRPVVDAAMAQGVLINSTHETVIRLLPPFLLQEQHVDKAHKVLRKVLAAQKLPQAEALAAKVL